MQTDPRLEDVNYKSEVDGIVKFALGAYSHAPQTNHFQFKMGSDFQYENANEWFKNLDKLIHYINMNASMGGPVVAFCESAKTPPFPAC